MKKLILLLIMLISIPNLKCEEKEVEYKWYKLIENDVHYESDVENSCEYFDKEDTKYTEFKYSMDLPAKKEGRIIEKYNPNINLHRQYFNILKINGFFVEWNESVNIIDINFQTNENKNIDFSIDDYYSKIADQNDNTFMSLKNIEEIRINFPNTVDASDFIIVMKYKKRNKEFLGMNFQLMLTNEISLNAFYTYNEIMENNCEDNICTLTTKINIDKMYKENINFKTILYRYKDTLYKCYSLEKLYAPGYYKELDGYIKDETNFKIIEKDNKAPIEEDNNTTEDITNNNGNNEETDNIKKTIPEENNNESSLPENIEILNDYNYINTDYEPEEISNANNLTPPKSTVAFVEKIDNKNVEKTDKYYIILSSLILLLILITIRIIKNIKKCRTK